MTQKRHTDTERSTDRHKHTHTHTHTHAHIHHTQHHEHTIDGFGGNQKRKKKERKKEKKTDISGCRRKEVGFQFWLERREWRGMPDGERKRGNYYHQISSILSSYQLIMLLNDSSLATSNMSRQPCAPRKYDDVMLRYRSWPVNLVKLNEEQNCGFHCEKSKKNYNFFSVLLGRMICFNASRFCEMQAAGVSRRMLHVGWCFEPSQPQGIYWAQSSNWQMTFSGEKKKEKRCLNFTKSRSK